MAQSTYQQKLHKQALFYFSIAIIIMSAFLLFGLAFYNRSFAELRLREASQEIQRIYGINVDAYKRELQEKNSLYRQFVAEEAAEADLYYAYYRFNAKQAVKGELFLFDEGMQTVFASNPALERGNFRHFLKTVIAGGEERDWNGSGEYVYLHENGEHYLIILQPLSKYWREGYAVYLINGKEIRSLISQSEAEYVLYDQFRNVFSSSSQTFLRGPLEKMDALLLEDRFAYEGENYQTRRSSLTPALNMIVYRRENVYLDLLVLSVVFVLGMGVLMLLLAGYMARRLSVKNAISVELLSSELDRVQANPAHRVQLSTGDEFEEISHDINRMLEQLSEAHQNNLELRDHSLLAERKKLEAQFNPHFLYNTLEVIRSSLHFAPALANDLILKLNKILRYSINEQQTEVSLGEDLAYIREYLEILQQRFEHFRYQIELEEGLAELPVPKLFLLPLIENSLKYGYPRRQDLVIRITISREGERVWMRVFDNGQALDEARCHQLNRALERNEVSRHHGLFNTKRRVELLDASATLAVLVQEDGTAVEITMGVRADV